MMPKEGNQESTFHQKTVAVFKPGRVETYLYFWFLQGGNLLIFLFK